MTDFIVTPFAFGDLEKLKEAGATGVVIATPFFSARGAAYFSQEELPFVKKECERLGLQMYILLNRFFVEEELERLRTFLIFLKDIDIDGIYYGDEGILYEADKLGLKHKLIYNPDTLITNKEDVQYYLDEGISMVTISKEITLDEICHIAKYVNGACEVILHGRLNMMHSKRTLLSNYLHFIGNHEDLKDNHNVYIMEETRDECMPIVEDETGTHVFTGFTLSSFDEIKDMADSGIQAFRIDGIFHDIDYVCNILILYREILQGIRNGRDTYKEFCEAYPEDNVTRGFYYTKTSKVK